MTQSAENDAPAPQVYYGALDNDGSMDWHESRERAERDAIEYGLPLYRVTIAYERVTSPGQPNQEKPI